MLKVRNAAMKVLAAGLGTILALSPLTQAIAEAASDTPKGEYYTYVHDLPVDGEAQAETKLYLKGQSRDLAVNEGSQQEQIKVTVPVAIHYAMNVDGSIIGPKDRTVKIVNNSLYGAVHVSKIAVEPTSDVKIVKFSEFSHDADALDEIALDVKPERARLKEDSDELIGPFVGGAFDEFGSYVDGPKDPAGRNDWDMVGYRSVVSLNSLTGMAVRPITIDPDADIQVGSVQWTVRTGTRQQADIDDASVTIHFHLNGGSYSAPDSDDLDDEYDDDDYDDDDEDAPTIVKAHDIKVPLYDVDPVTGARTPRESALDEEIDAAWGSYLSRPRLTKTGAVDDPFLCWSVSNVVNDRIDTVADLGDYLSVFGVNDIYELAGKTITLYARYV